MPRSNGYSRLTWQWSLVFYELQKIFPVCKIFMFFYRKKNQQEQIRKEKVQAGKGPIHHCFSEIVFVR